MRSDTEWGPWIEHDCKGCPVPIGVQVEVEYPSGNRYISDNDDGPWWRGGGYRRWRGQRAHWAPIIRYRIRKPRALLDLIELVENLPAPAKPQVPA